MTSLDLRVGALSLLGTPGTSRTLRLIFTAAGEPVSPGPVSVWIGGDERSPSDFTGATELPAVVDGNVATVTVPIPAGRELLRLTIDSALATIGTVAPSLRGTPDQDQTVQVNLGAVEVHVTSLVGTDVDPVAVVTDPAAQAALSATFGPAAVLLPLKERIAAGDRVIMFAAGDSTWNDSNDALRLHLAALAELLPDRTITYRPWSDALQAWGNLTTIQTGPDGDRYFAAVNGEGKYVTSDSADALVTTDLDITAKFAADDWDTFSGARFFCSDESSDPNRRWWFGMTAAGQLRLYWFPDGTASSQIQVNSTTNLSSVVSPVDGQPLTLRATLDVDNGAGGYEVTFFVNGQQLGDTVVGGSTTNLIASTRGVTLAGRSAGVGTMSGKLYSFTMRDGIDGAIIAAFDADHMIDPVTPYTDEHGITWTPHGAPDLGGSLGVLMLNGATAGKSVDYFTDETRWEAMSAAPVVNVAYVGLGHNAGTSVDFASAWAGLVDQIRARWPAAAIVASTQNPERSGAANWRQHAIRQRQVKETAIARGFVLVDAFRAFGDYGDWETDLMADDIHPNADGSAIWAAKLTEPFARALA